MRLSPEGHNTQGRTAFLIHGDNATMYHTASEGFIMLGSAVRKRIAESKITTLLVVK